jgi:hypothetical protein
MVGVLISGALGNRTPSAPNVDDLTSISGSANDVTRQGDDSLSPIHVGNELHPTVSADRPRYAAPLRHLLRTVRVETRTQATGLR